MKRHRILFGGGQEKEGDLPNTLFVDPGLGGTGWAFFPLITKHPPKALPPDSHGCFRPKQSHSWELRACEVGAWFHGLLRGTGVQHVVMEFAEVYLTNAVSMSAAQSGDLFKLVYLVGVLGEVTRMECGNAPILVKPKAWKGQLPKDVVIRRLQETFGKRFHQHEADAVGMGLAAQGLL